MIEHMTPGILVGAFERDNFGDLLFLSRTRELLGSTPAIATAPFSGDTAALGGEPVVEYAPLLRRQAVPFVWVVGGETGGASVRHARHMSLGEQTAPADDSPDALPDFVPAYLPRPSRHEGSLGAPYIVNSAGLSGVALLSGRRRIETIGSLREATFVSVREARSSAALRSEGIRHCIAPDLVHTILHSHRPRKGEERDVALVQCKARYINELGVAGFAQALLAARSLRAFRIRLFSAGDATGHDSRDLLLAVASEMRSRRPHTPVEVSGARTSIEKVDEIATCGLWIGTSLHGLIISTAYSVPRIGLKLRKLRDYAETWQIPYPADATLRSLDRAVAAALDATRLVDPARQAEELARLASKNASAAVAQLGDEKENELRIERQRNGARVADDLARVTPRGERWERRRLVLRRAARKTLRIAGAERHDPSSSTSS